MPSEKSKHSPKKSVEVSAARLLAHQVLVRVERDGAWADRALDHALQRTELAPRDRALATELVYGTLRMQNYLDFLLNHWAKKKMHRNPADLKVILRMAAFQMLYTRVPARAAVNEAVNLSKSVGHYASRFVNAVLRRLNESIEKKSLPEPAETLSALEALAIKSSQPLWALREIESQLGLEAANDWAFTNNQPPPITIRINKQKTTADKLIGVLRDSEVDVEVSPITQDALNLRRTGAITGLPRFAAGHFSVQDASAQLVSRLALPLPGTTIVDLCAAPGGKSTHLAELINDEGLVLALDLHASKTRLIAQNAERLNLKSIHPLQADATDPSSLSKALKKHQVTQADLVMLDAPCSGAGTFCRNPEIRYRKEETLPELVELQAAILKNAAPLVKAGGVLVYAVCTITEREGPLQVAKFLSEHPEFSVEKPEDPNLAQFLQEVTVDKQSFWCFRTYSHKSGGDSFFGVRLRRNFAQ